MTDFYFSLFFFSWLLADPDSWLGTCSSHEALACLMKQPVLFFLRSRKVVLCAFSIQCLLNAMLLCSGQLKHPSSSAHQFGATLRDFRDFFTLVFLAGKTGTWYIAHVLSWSISTCILFYSSPFQRLRNSLCTAAAVKGRYEFNIENSLWDIVKWVSLAFSQKLL